MYLPTYPQNGQGDDDPSGDGRFAGRDFDDGIGRSPSFVSTLVESSDFRPFAGLSRPASRWQGLLTGLNAAADAFAAEVNKKGDDRNAALARGLDAATQVINKLNKPPSAEAMRRATQQGSGFGQESSSPRRRTYPPGYDIDPRFAPDLSGPFSPGSGRGGSRPIGPGHDEGDGIPGARPIGLGRGDGNTGFGPLGLGHGEDSRHIFFEAAPGALRQYRAPSPGQTGLAAENTWSKAHPADPPAWSATFPRDLNGPVIPEPGDRDPETGRVDVNRLSGRIADRMVYGATGFVPASYATTSQPSRALTPDYLEPNTGARVPGDVDSDTANRAVLQASNNAGPTNDEGVGVVTVAARQGGEGQNAKASGGEQAGQPKQDYEPGADQYDPRTWPIPGEAGAKLWQDIKKGRSGPFIKEGGDPTNPHDYIYPHVAEPPNTPEGQRIRELIIKYANKYNVPVQLMFNKGFVESRYKQSATSKVGARGIFQLMPQTEETYNVKDRSSINENVKAACEYMAYLLHKYKGDPVKAEAAYHSGGTVLLEGNYLGPEGFAHLGKVLPGMSDAFRSEKVPPNITNDYYTYKYILGWEPYRSRSSRR